MSNIANDFLLRVADLSQDAGIIMDPWRHHIRSRYPFKAMSARTFNEHHCNFVIKHLLQRCVPVMMVSQEDPTFVYGWILGEMQGSDAVVHFAYVKESFRRHGCLKTLIHASLPPEKTNRLYFTHKTSMSDPVARSLGAIYDPYRVLWSGNV